jgi:hypothetical protein
MERRTFLLGSALLGVTLWSPSSLAATKIAVVVHPSNDVGALGLGELEAIFTTRRLYWPNGRAIAAYNLPTKHALRATLDRSVLRLEPDQVARFWIDRRVRGGHAPPRQAPSVEIMRRVVASLETGIGYVPTSDVTRDVKVIAEV